MKKVSMFCICLIVLGVFINNITVVKAKEKTLDELLASTRANRAAYNTAKSQKELTESEKVDVTNQKTAVQSEINSINSEIKKIESDIDDTKKQIEKKDEEIKEIMKFVQASEGQSTYLEYIFGASSFTDFIYRVSVAEQLSNYNDELIEEYNKDVKKLEDDQKSLSTKQAELTAKEQELTVLEAKLTKEVEEIKHGMLSKDEEYRTEINTINNMKKLGCSGRETLTSCKNKIASQVRPSSGSSGGGIVAPNSYGTHLPIARGYLTSDYGPRTGEFHTGMDFSSGSVDNVYPVADGKVINIDYGSNKVCGNNRIYVLHNIRGVTYTTSYWHLISVNVSVGQNVSASTKIGSMGGRGYVDPCARGGHVHLNLFRGYTTTNSGRINPRNIIPQAPSEWRYFNHR